MASDRREASGLIQRCRELDSPQQLSSLLEALEHLGDAKLDDLEEDGSKQVFRYLLGSVASESSIPLDEVAQALESTDDALANAAALYFVRRVGDNRKVQASLLLGADSYTSPSLDRDGRWRVVRMMGWSQDERYVPLLLEILQHHYHYYPPDYVAEALRCLDALPDPKEVPYARSITVSASGSRLLIHNDDRFSGRGCCADCRFMPCRVNRYYRGAIEDCKLFGRQDPDTLHELVDYRPNAASDPATVGLSERDKKKRFEELVRWAAESERLGHLDAAADKLRQAVRHAPDPNAQLDLVARAVRLKVQAGDRQGAFALLKLSEDKLRDASDERVIRRFDAAILALEEELGGYVDPEIRTLGSEESKQLSRLYRRLRRSPGSDRRELRRLMAGIIKQLRVARDEGLDPYGWLRKLLSLSHVVDYYGPAESWLSCLHRREPTHEEEALAWEMAWARLRGYRGERREARDRFGELLPRVRKLSNPERRLEFYADHLEALGLAAEEWEGERELVRLPLRLSQSTRELFRRLLAEQPGAAARRRFRERHQRTLENALCGLWRTAQVAGSDSTQGQALLAEAWSLIMTARNPELQTVRTQLSQDQARRLGNLEDSLHRGLAYMLLREHDAWEYWEVPSLLQRVVDFEMSGVDHRRVLEEGGYIPPVTGLASAFFEIKDRVVPENLMVLTYHEDRFTCHLVDDARRTLFNPLVSWVHSELKAADYELRRERSIAERTAAVSRDFEVFETTTGDDAHVPDREELRSLASRLLPSAELFHGAADETNRTWFVFSDGLLNQLPIELLTSSASASPRLVSGQPKLPS